MTPEEQVRRYRCRRGVYNQRREPPPNHVDTVEGQDRLIVKLLAGTVLRISELTSLKKPDLDLGNALTWLQAQGEEHEVS